ncbi:albumin-2-like [Vigna unguiculata]|uniref:Hemopexin-like repeat n=1 Tax=Vigna unguiculata TaxID=3917 RepID=A0A4D6MYV7_VIGUN|nr:albumin-2-like [Vigna unguiculata]QCE05065.1 Hemopexin-like repeat [Vigna unguiculata]
MSSPVLINAAIPSSRPYQVYFFAKNKYVRLYYTPGDTGDEIMTPLQLVSSGFSSLAGTAFAEDGIDCSFDTEGSKAYIFSSDICAYIDYAPHSSKDKILVGPTTIAQMFPTLRNTVFAEGIDAAFRSTKGKEVYLFKGIDYCRIAYDSKELVGSIGNITDGFPHLKGTIFESGIDASFGSVKKGFAYLFKEDKYTLLRESDGTFNQVRDILAGWPCLRGVFPVTE